MVDRVNSRMFYASVVYAFIMFKLFVCLLMMRGWVVLICARFQISPDCNLKIGDKLVGGTPNITSYSSMIYQKIFKANPQITSPTNIIVNVTNYITIGILNDWNIETFSSTEEVNRFCTKWNLVIHLFILYQRIWICLPIRLTSRIWDHFGLSIWVSHPWDSFFRVVF